MKTKFLSFMIMLVVTWSCHASTFSWDVIENPEGQNIGAITLGTVTTLKVVCANGLTSLDQDTYSSLRDSAIVSAAAHYGTDSVGWDNLVINTDQNWVSSDQFASGNTYFIVVEDADGNFFASNALMAYTSDGWSNYDTDISIPGNEYWSPSGYGLPGISTDDANRWLTAGEVVPEPGSTTLLACGLALLALRRNKKRLGIQS